MKGREVLVAKVVQHRSGWHNAIKKRCRSTRRKYVRTQPSAQRVYKEYVFARAVALTKDHVDHASGVPSASKIEGIHFHTVHEFGSRLEDM